MSWIRLDDKFARHPKIAALSDREFRTHIETMCWCADYDTEGVITEGAFAVVKHLDEKTAKRFIELGIWDEHEGVRSVHDWKVYNGATMEERVEAYLAQNPDASANEVHRTLGGKRALVLSAYAKLKADEPVPPRYPGGTPGGTETGSPSGSLSRDARGRASPAPAPQVLSSPSSVVEGAAPDDDESTKRELIRLANGDDQERRWIASYRSDPGRVIACLKSAKLNATTNVGGYLDRLIANGSVPDIDIRSTDQRVFDVMRTWIDSPAFDPESMTADSVLDELEVRERTLNGKATFDQRAALIRQADDRIEASATKTADVQERGEAA